MPVVGVGNAIAVAAGRISTCVLLSGGAVQCWEANLGAGTPTPLLVPGINDAVAVAASNGCTCAALSSGATQCWGVNKVGELGNGTTTDSAVPVTVTGISNAITVVCGTDIDGYNHTCALLRDGAIECWGDNSHGELGNGTTTNSPVPVKVVGL